MTHTANPERPIQRQEEDRLDRSAFVSRLVDALVNRETRRATGVVVGVTGPWGSGKSSVLNLLHREVIRRYPAALVIRFDPWLVSSHQDLVATFVDEVVSQIASREGDNGRWRDLSDAIERYGSAVAPVAKVLTPSLSGLLDAILSTVRMSKQSEGVNQLRSKLRAALEAVRAPLIVLIDELDRVEDDEVKTVARLIRSVLDFPQISYVVGYDHDRVVQALGSTSRGTRRERVERGRAYLEKIVQIAIPLPITESSELKALFEAELHGLSLDPASVDAARLTAMVNLLIPGVIQTPRDVKRVIGVLRVLRPMVEGEVDTVDLIGYCALAVKAPRSVDRLRVDIDSIVDDPSSEMELMLRATDRNARRTFIIAEELSEPISQLSEALFPLLTGSPRARPTYSDPISGRRALRAVQRLGLSQGQVSRSHLMNWLSRDDEDAVAELALRVENGSADDLLDRFYDTYGSLKAEQRLSAWRKLMLFGIPNQNENSTSFLQRRRITDDASRLLTIHSRRDDAERKGSADVFMTLKFAEDVVFVPIWMRRHFFMYGIYVDRKDGESGAFLGLTEVQSFAEQLSEDWKAALLTGKLFPVLRDLHALFLIVDVGKWDTSCVDALRNALSSNDGLERFVLMAFGANYFVERESIDLLCGTSFLWQRLDETSESFNSSDEILKNARVRARRGDPFVLDLDD